MSTLAALFKTNYREAKERSQKISWRLLSLSEQEGMVAWAGIVVEVMRSGWILHLF